MPAYCSSDHVIEIPEICFTRICMRFVYGGLEMRNSNILRACRSSVEMHMRVHARTCAVRKTWQGNRIKCQMFLELLNNLEAVSCIIFMLDDKSTLFVDILSSGTCALQYYRVIKNKARVGIMCQQPTCALIKPVLYIEYFSWISL